MAPLVGKAGAVSERLQVNVGEGVGREVEHLVSKWASKWETGLSNFLMQGRTAVVDVGRAQPSDVQASCGGAAAVQLPSNAEPKPHAAVPTLCRC